MLYFALMVILVLTFCGWTIQYNNGTLFGHKADGEQVE